NRKDLPRDILLDSVVVLRYEKRSKYENKGKVLTEMELVLEQTQQGTSYEVSVSSEGVEELKRKVKIKGEKKEALLTLRQKPEHQSDTQVITVKMEILLEPTSNKLMVGRSSQIRRIIKDGGEVKEFQRSFRHSDTERLSQSDEVLVKEYQERWLHSLSNIKNSMSMSVQKSQDHKKAKITRWRIEIMPG
ncbi:hypothetical protein Tco_0683715, partial [Tanacetum coccineum]